MNNYKKIIIVILLLVNSSAQAQLALLEKAYKMKSTELLDSFITNWMNELPAISYEELSRQNDTIKAVYELFRLNFDPHNVSKFTDSINQRHYDSLYKDIRFAIIPNQIKYSITDEFVTDTWLTNQKYKDFFKNTIDTERMIRFLEPSFGNADSILLEDSITYFRPIIDNDINPLYLNSRYDSVINNFIYRSDREKWLEGSSNGRRNEKEVLQRVEFLEKKLLIPNPLFASWHLLTLPEVYSIRFNQNFQKAKVWYFFNCSVWESIFVKELGTWKFQKNRYVMCVCG
ncbi:MAG: hypothetical protein ABI528_07580 [bacterium]